MMYDSRPNNVARGLPNQTSELTFNVKMLRSIILLLNLILTLAYISLDYSNQLTLIYHIGLGLYNCFNEVAQRSIL